MEIIDNRPHLSNQAVLTVNSQDEWRGRLRRRLARELLLSYVAAAACYVLLWQIGARADCRPNQIDGQCGMTTAFGAFFGIVGAVGIVLTVHVRKLLRYRRESRGCSLRDPASSVEQRASRAVDREHLAIITWSKAMELHGLPSALEAIDPVWRERAPGWSLVSRFARPPHELGNPTPARVRFLMPDAPDLWMVPGTMLRMFERETQQLAEVFILD